MKCPNNCGCGSCNPSVNGNYVNGILTVNVGTSTAVIPISQTSIETRTPVKEEFNLGSGNILILTYIPILNLGINVLRNGLLCFSSEYTINNKTITFTTNFGNSSGGTGLENIIVNYYK